MIVNFIFVTCFIIWCYAYNSANVIIDTNEELYKFNKPLYNKLLRASYLVPIVWFVDAGDKQKNIEKTRELERKLAKANLMHIFTARSFYTLKVISLLGGMLLGLVVAAS